MSESLNLWALAMQQWATCECGGAMAIMTGALLVALAFAGVAAWLSR